LVVKIIHMNASLQSGGVIAVVFALGAGTACAQDIVTAVERGEIAQVRRLLQTNPDLLHVKDSLERTLLHVAAERNRRTIAGLLIEKGLNVNALAKGEITALHSAAYRGSTDVAMFLLEKGADLKLVDHSGSTALHYAAARWDRVLIGKLLDKGAEINLAREDGATPLLLLIPDWLSIDDKTDAALRPILALLLSHEADPNTAAKDGTTALHKAARGNLLQAANALLTAKADVNPRNADQKTPFTLASEHGFQKMMALLKQHGGAE
jgi:ankyrin repeat protein